MMHLHYLIFASFAVITSGTVNYLKGVPRLSNTSYWDYYFICTTRGQTQQWNINNSALGEFSPGVVSQVLSDTNSTFNYIITLLSQIQLPSGDLNLTSMLIVGCQDGCYLEVSCSNGSLNMQTNNAQNRTGVNNNKNDTFVFLDYLLTQNIFGTDTSEYISTFICGVENMFLTWQVDAFDESLSFTSRDTFGQNRRTLQESGSTIIQQGIFIGNKPYPLVTVLIVIHSSVLNVTCGYSENEVSLTTELLPTMQSTLPNSTPTSKRTTTIENSSGVNVVAAAVVTPLIILVITIIVILISVFLIIWLRNKANRRLLNTTDGSPLDEQPLQDVNFNGRGYKIQLKDVDYASFRERIEFVITVVTEKVYDAATISLKPPDIENDDQQRITKIDEDIYVGMLGNTAVGLVKHKIGKDCVDFVEKAIQQWFPKAEFLLSVGICYALAYHTKLGDVLISKKLVIIRKNEDEQKKTIKMSKNIKDIFCSTLYHYEGLQVTSNRNATNFKDSIASGPAVRRDELCQMIAKNENSLGVERSAGYLYELEKKGIKMPDDSVKRIHVIAIKGVHSHISKDDEQENDWKFKAGQAAFHYVEAALNARKMKNSTAKSGKKTKD